MFLHNAQELDNNLRARSDQHLALSGFFGIVNAFQRIVEDRGFDHIGEDEGG